MLEDFILQSPQNKNNEGIQLGCLVVVKLNRNVIACPSVNWHW